MKKLAISFLVFSFVGASFAGVGTDDKKKKTASQKEGVSKTQFVVHNNVKKKTLSKEDLSLIKKQKNNQNKK